VEVAAYRIALEALTNVVRHAQARTCIMSLSAADDLCLQIVDDGLGLPASFRPGVGVSSMRERAGELGGECAVEPGPKGGVRVRVRLPIAEA
jgi:signal transduction histidine kinase